jgi:hypothetical protein
MQGYTSFGRQNTASIRLGMDWNVLKDIGAGKLPLSKYIEELRGQHEDNCAVEVYDLCEAGRVVGLGQYDASIHGLRVSDLRGSSTEEVFETVISGKQGFGHFELDLSPYTVERFDENSKGAIRMRKRILELGFVLSDEEEKFWQEWINDELEQEAEDGF